MRTGRALAVVVALVLAGCSGGDEAADPAEGVDRTYPAPTQELIVTASPAEARADEAIVLEVAGARPGERVAIEVTSTDDVGVTWSSTTRVTAGDEGRAVLEEDPMRPFTNLTPDPGTGLTVYTWSREDAVFTVTARAGDRATDPVEVRRRLVSEGVSATPTTPEDDGVVGELWSPAPGTAVGAGAVVIGGSEGGLGASKLDAAALASRGVTALQVAYFEAPGLPDQLTEIPLETFVTAVHRLREEPDVDPERVWLTGASRGSEAAALVGARHPDLVAGVVLAAPSGVAVCGLPACSRSAWTEGGVPVPFTRRPGADDPASVIPVEDVDGPVIATCGGADALWPSCAQAEAMFDRLDAADRPPGDHLVSEPLAGHRVAHLTPYLWPLSGGDDDPSTSGDPVADDRVRAEAWSLALEAMGADPP